MFVLIVSMAMEVSIQDSRAAPVGGPIAVASSDGFCMLCAPERHPFASVSVVAAGVDVALSAVVIFAIARIWGMTAAALTTVIATLFHPVAIAIGAHASIDPVISWAIPLLIGLGTTLVVRQIRRRARPASP